MNIVFDVDDTMYDLMEPFRMAHERYFADRTMADCAGLFDQSRIYSDVILEQERQGIVRSEDAFFRRIQRTYQDAGIDVTREESDRFEQEYRYWQSRIRMFGFMKDILDYCRKERIPMAVLTNGNSEGQRKKTRALGLNRWIEEDRIFVTGEIGYHKPDIRAFRAVEERTGFGPRDTWYVGDSYESDVEGASRAGWHTVWLNHRKRPCPSLNSLAEVEVKEGRELLERLCGRF